MAPKELPITPAAAESPNENAIRDLFEYSKRIFRKLQTAINNLCCCSVKNSSSLDSAACSPKTLATLEKTKADYERVRVSLAAFDFQMDSLQGYECQLLKNASEVRPNVVQKILALHEEFGRIANEEGKRCSKENMLEKLADQLNKKLKEFIDVVSELMG